MINIIQGDICAFYGDAIVNAANSSLLGGGGVDGAIHRAAGPLLLEECRALGGCAAGEAKLTRGYKLPARYVIHAVGPVYRDGSRGEAELLKSCYQKSLQLAWENQLYRIAFPNISTGVFGYPKEAAAEIAISTAKEFLALHPEIELWFYCFDSENYAIYQRHLI